MEGCLDGCVHKSGIYNENGAHALIYRLESYNETSGYENSLGVYQGADIRVLACVDLESEGELPTREK